MNPGLLIQQRGLKKSWVAGQMGISPSYLSRLLSGEYDWPKKYRRLFALVVGTSETAIDFAQEATQNAEKAYAICSQNAPTAPQVAPEPVVAAIMSSDTCEPENGSERESEEVADDQIKADAA